MGGLTLNRTAYLTALRMFSPGGTRAFQVAVGSYNALLIVLRLSIHASHRGAGYPFL